MMPRMSASQSREVGKMERMSKIIQKIIQMNELAILRWFLRIEKKI